MQLRTNRASPFARKVRILAREAGLAARIEEIEIAVSPTAANESLARENPLVKIPALVTDEGGTLYDSRVICEYLDALHGEHRFFPEGGPARFAALRRQALCDGILDAAVLCRYELALRPEALRWADWIEGQKRKIFGGLAALEREVESWGEQFAIGQIGAACVLGYLDFRFAGWEWRARHPRLAEWYGRVSRRPAVAQTAPA
ncbi:MAG TPA: glutathione S-transferase [Burkholderiales bacterium]|nr:glutathione S-transferase [Burkholderiales bacterium]